MEIHKYTIDDKFGSDPLDMRSGAKIIKVDRQHQNACIWAIVDPNAKMIDRKYLIKGTGSNIDDIDPDKFDHIGTVLIQNDTLVWHIWLEKEGV